jgi:hypothetical protein
MALIPIPFYYSFPNLGLVSELLIMRGFHNIIQGFHKLGFIIKNLGKNKI